MATEKYNKQEPVNIGAGFEITIRNLVDKLVTIMDYKGKIRWDKTKPNGQPRRACDTTKAKEKFAFEAKIPLREGLKRTIEWYKKQKEVFGEKKDT